MIYDCFPFFNELDLLEIRLHELANTVDYFVLSEATVTHQNTPKPLYYDLNKDRFRDFKDKIIHNVITDASSVYKGNAWNIDYYMHNNIHSKGIIKDDDLVIIGDADQIVSSRALKTLDLSKSHYFDMIYSYYFFNCVHLNMTWGSSFITKKSNIHCPASTIRYDPKKSGIPFFQVANGGWHFSYMGGIASIKQKIKAFSDVTVNRPEFLDDNHLIKAINEGKDLYNRTCEGRMGFVPLDDRFPEYVLKNKDKFSTHIREVSNA